MMSSRKARTQGTRRARCARWLGLDRNPLRRRTDRIETALRLVVMILLGAAVPLAAVAAGQWTDHLALRQVHAQQAADHRVTAVLLQQAPATGTPDPYSNVQTAWVLARWQPPGGPARTGQVLAPAGTPKGSTVQTWVDPSGAVTDPPADHRDAVASVFIAVVVTCTTSWLVLGGLAALARRAINRRRLNAWDAEWRTIGPLWSGHHI